MIFGNDKFIVVCAVVILVLGSLWVMGPGAKEIVSNALSGLFGMVTGSALTYSYLHRRPTGPLSGAATQEQQKKAGN